MDIIAVLLPCWNEASTIAKVVQDFEMQLQRVCAERKRSHD